AGPGAGRGDAVHARGAPPARTAAAALAARSDAAAAGARAHPAVDRAPPVRRSWPVAAGRTALGARHLRRDGDGMGDGTGDGTGDGAPAAGFLRQTLPRQGRAGEWLGWTVLGALLLATLLAAVAFDRTGRPSLVGDEATYAVRAGSLAWDFDLAYTRADYDRFVAQWGGPPDGVILQSSDAGAHITYGKPFLYALVVAPFVRLAPLHGALVANALLLAAAALLAARTLRLRLGGVAPFAVAVLVFGSVAFAYVFWVHADVLLLAATAAGFAVVYGEDRSIVPRGMQAPTLYGDEPAGDGRRWRRLGRWALAGALLAVPGAFRPFYLALLLPAALAVPAGRPRQRGSALGAGGAVPPL